MRDTRLIAAMLVSAAVLGLGACAVTPPGKLLPISDATAVAGKWQGTVRDIRGRLTDTFLTLTDTGKDTGTSESFVEGSVFTGTFRIKDGKGETETADGRLGTMTLYERAGKPLLSTYTTPGLWGEFTRAP